MHPFCWDHPGSKRLLRCSLTGVAGTELKSVGILRGMLLGQGFILRFIPRPVCRLLPAKCVFIGGFN